MSDRFYVVTHTGICGTLPNAPPTHRFPALTEVMILDRAYCHRVVHSELSGARKEKRRLIARAENLAAEWNQADGQE